MKKTSNFVVPLIATNAITICLLIWCYFMNFQGDKKAPCLRYGKARHHDRCNGNANPTLPFLLP